ncbi:MAG: SDR family oxidoreductase [Fuerstiella sp.]|nr:SDR family oxidoreductase [Fuerstiella sp.]
MTDRFSLRGRNAIITGGTRGIGLAIAQGFLEAGAKVTICSRKQYNVDEALTELAEFSDSIQGVAAHVGKTEDLERLISHAETRFGPVGILVNNAGTNPYFGPLIKSEEAAWDKTMQVNLKGPYMLSKLVAKKMVAGNGGSIINIASVAGQTALAMQGIYSITKAGVIMLTKVMAKELGAQNVRVNCICPGVVRTKLSEALWADPKMEKQMASLKALGRVGNTDELTGAAVYLASDAGSFTTGATLNVDGGMVI